ncbi:AAA family ATPase [Chlorobaculum limnaeum]|uniref:Replication-associated recombination protein A n=1 Tax=Chlorobaculum limnaeum TaxID=274537 RepID=A0A1D8D4A4_CHLLM|nr:replication-associated recombination protein A [Chlorobaculum limnaeum]AOS83977.1 AAA family ATPase [Chlorobaculum limnaeum]
MKPEEPEQPDLFGFPSNKRSDAKLYQPLAERVRPRTIDELFGQEHLVGAAGPIRRYIEEGRIPSMIFWGPPGSGKTTLAEICAGSLNYRFEQLSATDAGVKDVRRVLELAQKSRSIDGRQMLLFIDEIHRFNKAQQDTLLHAIEQGLVVLIGATTENPSFEVNRALLSRMQVYILQPLGDDEVRQVVERAIADDPAMQAAGVEVRDMEFLLAYAAGDARKALNALEAAASLVPRGTAPAVIDRKLFEQALQHRAPAYDKGGEAHYDTVSAFIKSMRGSDPDAALFWMARMIDGGEDPKFIARRMVIFASEDIGNADPYALTLAVAVFHAVELIGLPEARINLAQGATYLASCPKSNASYEGIGAALADVKSAGASAVPPLHLRNAPTDLMKEIGYGKGYRYPHSFPGHFVDEHYFPEQMEPKAYYRPTGEGREKFIRERLEGLWKDRYKE